MVCWRKCKISRQHLNLNGLKKNRFNVMDIKQKIQQLRAELTQHNYSYYVLDNPTISDYE
ncbi:MAG: hypothetical protein KDD18_07525, partial [Mangrovimonas sp.]|nr:hypothetical protein [Mangrovimonas sp.]